MVFCISRNFAKLATLTSIKLFYSQTYLVSQTFQAFQLFFLLLQQVLSDTCFHEFRGVSFYASRIPCCTEKKFNWVLNVRGFQRNSMLMLQSFYVKPISNVSINYVHLNLRSQALSFQQKSQSLQLKYLKRLISASVRCFFII